ncbi:chlorophyll synthase ChlG [Fulvimarina sp. 2208YS6-2-32]|uniref:Chlorophyll synthase ChlG n=1 Tax=Fulvimarina uroteuthidis TaxID=3098149 RepID=A0ABU5I172_9HYPH|nr:chlorophyll synthase ChlG [Fulvimarina sp. 2208YS6-2-32]MDY8108503.1 chlorophyll synthase ChlG [Fulvimarina sp. 2208YS6-2-32]
MSRTVAPHAQRTRIQFSAFVTVLKPVTWFAPVWAFACGAISAIAQIPADASTFDLVAQVALGLALAGPMLCGASQAVNDWFDRHVDAVNEPDRPIPSGRLPGRTGLAIAVLWTLASLAVAALLGPVVFLAAFVGCLLSWGYSAPPVRFKQDGWLGNASVAIAYEGLAWITGAAVIAQGVPAPEILVLAALYSIGAHGIMTLNDFKAIAGDVQFGIRTLPVRYGVKRAAQIACVVMALPQLLVIGVMTAWGHPVAAGIIALLLIGQGLCMPRLIADPEKEAIRYNGTGIGLFVLGMMVSAVAVGVFP